MKKSLFILAAASAVAFAACNGGNNEGSYTQEQVDSMAAAMKDSAGAAMKASADSAIQAQANATARSADSLRVIDSIIAATRASSTKTTVIKKTGSNGGKTTTTTTKTEEVVEAPTAVKTDQKAKFDQMKSNSNTISDQKKQEQKSKFDQMK